VWASRKFARSKTAKRSSYKSGGTEGALERAMAELEVKEKCDLLESWHGSDVVLDNDELDLVDGAFESDDE